jgi:UPF0176 protein
MKTNPQIVATFYKFVQLADYTEKRAPLLTYCQEQGIKGTILLAEEGINATISGSRQTIDALLYFLRSDSRLADLEPKESHAEGPPFERMKVRLKKEIVTLGIPEIAPERKVGSYVQPKDWNTLITDPDVLVIDTRNQLEVKIGSFQRAENPHIESFREFPAYARTHLDPEQHKKVALFCTGGIRCEKASSFLLEQGFQEVYHLQGGIFKYLEEIPSEESLWQGECFVFDQRVAIDHSLAVGSYASCQACGNPISEADRASADYQENVSCPHCATHKVED